MSEQKTESILSLIKNAIPDSLKANIVNQTRGLFAELYESSVFPQYYLACAIDGVGTKCLIATALDRFDTIGIDLVAMCSNDLATLGNVQQFLFMDYLALQDDIKSRAGEIITGISNGLKMCDTSDIFQSDVRINFGKGETASVSEMLGSFRNGYGFDIAGAMIGFISKNHKIKEISAGDKIIALKSSGLHSNGYTDARKYLLNGDFETRHEIKKMYKGRFGLRDKFRDKTIGDVLLEPTKIYNNVVSAVAKRFRVIGVNNTGYGLKNFNRSYSNVEFVIDNPIKQDEIFNLIQRESKFSDKKMYETFNMSMGFFLIVDKDDVGEILRIIKGYKEYAQVVGYVKSSNKIRTVLVKDKRIIFEGY